MRFASILSLSLLLSVAACGSDATGPKFDPDAFAGIWNLAVDAEAGCWPAFEIRFHIDPPAEGGGPSTSIDIASEWWLSTNPDVHYPVSGIIGGATDGFRLSFWKRPDRPGVFSGSSVAPDRLRGEFSDPTHVFRSGFDNDVCTGTATATRIDGLPDV